MASPRRAREVYLLQRKATQLGKGLGKTTGWIHRAALKVKRVEMIGRRATTSASTTRACTISFGEKREACALAVDTSCSARARSRCASCWSRCAPPGARAHLIGGADVAAELDAKRAIDQGTRLGAQL